MVSRSYARQGRRTEVKAWWWLLHPVVTGNLILDVSWQRKMAPGIGKELAASWKSHFVNGQRLTMLPSHCTRMESRACVLVDGVLAASWLRFRGHSPHLQVVGKLTEGTSQRDDSSGAMGEKLPIRHHAVVIRERYEIRLWRNGAGW